MQSHREKLVAAFNEEPPCWGTQFNEDYALEKGIALKNVRSPNPFVRTEFLNYIENKLFTGSSQKHPTTVDLVWEGGLRDWRSYHSCGKSKIRTLESLLIHTLGLESNQIQGSPALLGIDLEGDWVIGANASIDQKIEALESILQRDRGLPISIKREDKVTTGLRVTGDLQIAQLPSAPDPSRIHVYREEILCGSQIRWLGASQCLPGKDGQSLQHTDCR